MSKREPITIRGPTSIATVYSYYHSGRYSYNHYPIPLDSRISRYLLLCLLQHWLVIFIGTRERCLFNIEGKPLMHQGAIAVSIEIMWLATGLMSYCSITQSKED